jgi:hypothetical protein
MRFLLAFIAAVLVAVGGVFVVAGGLPAPTIEIRQPAKFVGASSPLEVTVSAPGANLKDLQIVPNRTENSTRSSPSRIKEGRR